MSTADVTPPDKLQRIRELNDVFRSSGRGGKIVVTPGIRALGETTIAAIMLEVARFDAFNEANDPHSEHDFGSFQIGAQTVFWKIDYYDEAMLFGSDDPSDESKTLRVMTVLLAEEY